MIVYHILHRNLHSFYSKTDDMYPFDKYDVKLNIVKVIPTAPINKDMNENDFNNYISTPPISKTSI